MLTLTVHLAFFPHRRKFLCSLVCTAAIIDNRENSFPDRKPAYPWSGRPISRKCSTFWGTGENRLVRVAWNFILHDVFVLLWYLIGEPKRCKYLLIFFSVKVSTVDRCIYHFFVIYTLLKICWSPKAFDRCTPFTSCESFTYSIVCLDGSGPNLFPSIMF